MTQFDFILAGGGMAGLSLAYHMLHSPLKEKQILIIDQAPKTENDRTWCFWAQEDTLYAPILRQSWDHLQFHGLNFSKTYALPPYRYNLLRGIDFYRHTQGALRQAPNVHFLYGDVAEIKSSPVGGTVVVDGKAYAADWVFDSLFLPEDYPPQEKRYHYLWQHFKGWVVRTPEAIFDPELPTLFDFRTPQNGAMRFIYILPLSDREALVEYTLFSATLLPDQAYDQALEAYLEAHLQIRDYEVSEVEQGRIPMTDQPFPRFPGPHHMTIGTKGGRVKPSTGYAFLRTQQDSRAIVQSLLEYGDPTHIPADRPRAKAFDAIMLEVMEQNGDRMAEIFTAMFKGNPIQRIFRFLDESSSIWDDLGIIRSVPPMPFIKAMFRTGFRPGK